MSLCYDPAMSRYITYIIFSFSLLCYSSNSFSLEEDQTQPINIAADAATVDDKNGITVYSGNVSIDQGSLLITADNVRVITSKNEVIQIIASADAKSKKLVHYQQDSDESAGRVSADAKLITYFLQEERSHLSGNANLNQAGDVFSGDLLYYDIKKGIVDLKGSSKKRVNITLTPK